MIFISYILQALQTSLSGRSINTTQLRINLPNISALFTETDSPTTTLTKKDLKKVIYKAYQTSQNQLKQAPEELLPAAMPGGLITLLLSRALTS
ncbi:hypothetical protein PMIT1313_00395 [Prochlorococcus marinus str. MIT 1313]|nr:hypothetical protein PMIT1313_00395 [Prochlorococcus marinus str. MIT 1313]